MSLKREPPSPEQVNAPQRIKHEPLSDSGAAPSLEALPEAEKPGGRTTLPERITTVNKGDSSPIEQDRAAKRIKSEPPSAGPSHGGTTSLPERIKTVNKRDSSPIEQDRATKRIKSEPPSAGPSHGGTTSLPERIKTVNKRGSSLVEQDRATKRINRELTSLSPSASRKRRLDSSSEDGNIEKKRKGGHKLAWKDQHGLKMRILHWKKDDRGEILYLVEFTHNSIDTMAHALVPQTDLPLGLTCDFPLDRGTNLKIQTSEQMLEDNKWQIERVSGIAFQSPLGTCMVPPEWELLQDYINLGSDIGPNRCRSALDNVYLQLKWPGYTTTWEEAYKFLPLRLLSAYKYFEMGKKNETRYRDLIKDARVDDLKKLKR